MNIEHWVLTILLCKILACRPIASAHWVLNIEHWALNIEHWALIIEYWILNIEHFFYFSLFTCRRFRSAYWPLASAFYRHCEGISPKQSHIEIPVIVPTINVRDADISSSAHHVRRHIEHWVFNIECWWFCFTKCQQADCKSRRHKMCRDTDLKRHVRRHIEYWILNIEYWTLNIFFIFHFSLFTLHFSLFTQ
jgi:hypothetical protein